MREILFRAKRKDNGEWVEGYYCFFMNNHCILPQNLDTTPATLFREKKLFFLIDPETLCQYTGLKDKNGNMIWENDIISINAYDYMEPTEDFFGQVIYDEGAAYWCILRPDNEKLIPLCECKGSYQTDRFVDGNIFDNLGLLESRYAN